MVEVSLGIRRQMGRLHMWRQWWPRPYVTTCDNSRAEAAVSRVEGLGKCSWPPTSRNFPRGKRRKRVAVYRAAKHRYRLPWRSLPRGFLASENHWEPDGDIGFQTSPKVETILMHSVM